MRWRSSGCAASASAAPSPTGAALAHHRPGRPGLMVILAGQVDVTHVDKSGQRVTIVDHGPGEFVGELAQLAGRPALADVTAEEPVQALVIPPDRLRALLIAEAELGERIMRALIIRRVGLLETGSGGPIIVGRADNGDVLRLRELSAPQRSAAAIARPRHRPRSQGADRALPCRSRATADRALPQRAAAAQSNRGRTGALHRHWSARSIRTASTTLPWSAPGPPGLPPRCMPRPKGCPLSCSTAAASAARPAPRRASKIISAFRPASPAWP